MHLYKGIFYCFIAPIREITMFYIKYLTMNKVHMHTGAIRRIFCCCFHAKMNRVTDINPLSLYSVIVSKTSNTIKTTKIGEYSYKFSRNVH